MSGIQNPLHIPKEALVKRLEEVHGEHEDKRLAANEKAAEARSAVLALVAELDDDQVVNILDHKLGGFGEKKVVEFVEDVLKHDKFRTIEPEPTGIETSLQRTIRVLKMATDKELEIKPSDEVYSYL